MIGKTFSTKEAVRMIPDILQNGEQFFFPIFSSVEEMGEYGEHFSKVQKHILEVIPMARSQVGRKLVSLGGAPEYREGVVTDNGNVILDVHNFAILNPVEMEKELNNVAGVVTNGIFALRGADIVIVGTPDGAKVID